MNETDSDRVVSLAAGGMTTLAVAEKLGLPAAEVSAELVRVFRAKYPNRTYEEAMELERITFLYRALWPGIVRGEVDAVGAALQVSRRREDLVNATRKAPARKVQLLMDELVRRTVPPESRVESH